MTTTAEPIAHDTRVVSIVTDEYLGELHIVQEAQQPTQDDTDTKQGDAEPANPIPQVQLGIADAGTQPLAETHQSVPVAEEEGVTTTWLPLHIVTYHTATS